MSRSWTRSASLVATLAVACAFTAAAILGIAADVRSFRSAARSHARSSPAAARDVDPAGGDARALDGSPGGPDRAAPQANREAEPLVCTAPDDPDWARMKDRFLAVALLARLEEGAPGVRRVEAALESAGLRGRLARLRLPPPAPDALARRLVALENAAGSADAALRALSMRGFAALGAAARGAEAVVAVALVDDDLAVRVAAARALGEVGADPSSGGWALARATNDGEPEVRLAAIEALGALARDDDAGSSVATIAGHLADCDAGVREAAARALGRMGSAASSALGPLDIARGDPDGRVAAAASAAARDIRGS